MEADLEIEGKLFASAVEHGFLPDWDFWHLSGND